MDAVDCEEKIEELEELDGTKVFDSWQQIDGDDDEGDD